jgi:microcystin-dependent protein
MSENIQQTKFKQGRLGIGTNNPKFPLDIVGDIRLTGCIRDASGVPLPLSGSHYKDFSNNNLVIWNKNDLNIPGVNIHKRVGINKNNNLQSALDISGGMAIDTLSGNKGEDNLLSFDNNFFVHDLNSNAELYIRDTQLRAVNEGNGWFRVDNTLLTKRSVNDTINTVKMYANEYYNLRLRKNQTSVNTPIKTTIHLNLDCSSSNLNINNAEFHISQDISLNKFIIVNNSVNVDLSMNLQGDIKTKNLIVQGYFDVSQNVSIQGPASMQVIDSSRAYIKTAQITQNMNIGGELIIQNTASTMDLSVNNIFVNDSVMLNLNIKKDMDFSCNEISYIKDTLLVKGYLKSKQFLHANKLNVNNDNNNNNTNVLSNLACDGLVTVNNSATFNANHITVGDISINNIDVSNISIRNGMDVIGDINVGDGNSYQDISNVDISGEITGGSFVGMISWFASLNNPPGWLKCDGGEYNKFVYPQLFSIIKDVSSTFIIGDISFNVPDLMDISRCYIRGTNTQNKIGNKYNYTTDLRDSMVTMDTSGEHTHTISETVEPIKHTHGYINKEVKDILDDVQIAPYTYEKLQYFKSRYYTYKKNYQITWTYTAGTEVTTYTVWFDNYRETYTARPEWWLLNGTPGMTYIDSVTDKYYIPNQPSSRIYTKEGAEVLDGLQTPASTSIKDNSNKQTIENEHEHECSLDGNHVHGTGHWDSETAPESIYMVPFIKY